MCSHFFMQLTCYMYYFFVNSILIQTTSAREVQEIQNEITELDSARCARMHHPRTKCILVEHTRCARMRHPRTKCILVEHTRCARMHHPRTKCILVEHARCARMHHPRTKCILVEHTRCACITLSSAQHCVIRHFE